VENTTLLKKPRARKSDDPVRAWINKNFLIRYKHPAFKGSRLVSAGQYAKLLEQYHPTIREGFVERKNKDFKKVINSTDAKIFIDIRDGLRIVFVAK